MNTVNDNRRASRTGGFVLALMLAAGLLPFGCGESNNPTPPDTGVVTTSDAGVKYDTGTQSPDAPVGGNTGTDGGSTGLDGGGTDGGPIGVPGCFAGKPTDKQSVQFLNACTGTTCFPFDNAARLPLYSATNPPPL